MATVGPVSISEFQRMCKAMTKVQMELMIAENTVRFSTQKITKNKY